ncbi:MAG: hypothetical protein WBI04_04175 [Trichlorobacter sp.]|jgi:hypothetical protein
MNDAQLILTIPHGNVTATSLGIDGLAKRRSPGSGKHFRGRSILIDLACDGVKPGFSYLDEGGWRDAQGDSVAALAGVKAGSRTKTALSSVAFSAVPISAFQNCSLVKTGGEVVTLAAPRQLISYTNHGCNERMTSEQVADTIGQPSPAKRTPRLYMVIAPIQFLMLSNLTPEEYAWYATHRPGKMFRQVMFTELGHEEQHIAAESRYNDAKRELIEKVTKKTKSIAFEDCINQIPFQHWVGYHKKSEGGLYVGDRNGLSLYQFPDAIPHAWDRCEG